jgi:hypothetical protein
LKIYEQIIYLEAEKVNPVRVGILLKCGKYLHDPIISLRCLNHKTILTLALFIEVQAIFWQLSKKKFIKLQSTCNLMVIFIK